MTQNASDVEIANQGFAAFRQDLNDVLEDITTLHSGDTAPTTTYANQWWYETDTDKLYIRNEDNDAWIEILTLDQANDHLATLGASITLDGTGNVSIDSGDFTVDTDTLYVDSTNNRVGVGTTSPTRTLYVDGQIGASGRIHTASGSATDCGLGVGDDNTGLFRAATNSIGFSTNGSERMRILSGGGITFNGDTASANALDDYEEGTFSPTYIAETTNPTVTYERQNGHYVKIGRQVIATIELRTTTVSGGSGGVIVSGLPFTPVTESGQVRSGTANIGYTNSFNGSNPQAAYINGGVDAVLLHTNSGSDARGPLNTKITTSNLGTGTNANYLIMTAVYITS